MFRSAENFADNSAFFQKLFELNNDRFDEIFSFLDFLVNVCYEIFIAFGIEVFEAQIFEFAFYLRNAETPCKRRKISSVSFAIRCCLSSDKKLSERIL